MKKLIFIITLIFLGFISMAQELSDYEKYRLAQEEKRFNPAPDTVYKTDTVYIESPKTIVNNYYDNDNDPDIRFRIYFGHSWYYRPYYFWDPFYYDWYYPYYPYYSYNYWRPRHYYPYWYYSHYNSHVHYYKPSYNRYHTYRDPRVYRNSPITNRSTYTRYPSNSYVKTNTTRKPVEVNRTVTVDRNTNRVINSTPQRTYTPSYNRPKINTHSEYNNSRSYRNTTTTRVETRIERPASTYTRPSSSSSYNRPSPSRSSAPASRSYSTPSRSSAPASRSYSTPRSSSSGSSRSSSSSSRR